MLIIEMCQPWIWLTNWLGCRLVVCLSTNRAINRLSCSWFLGYAALSMTLRLQLISTHVAKLPVSVSQMLPASVSELGICCLFRIVTWFLFLHGQEWCSCDKDKRLSILIWSCQKKVSGMFFFARLKNTEKSEVQSSLPNNCRLQHIRIIRLTSLGDRTILRKSNYNFRKSKE